MSKCQLQFTLIEHVHVMYTQGPAPERKNKTLKPVTKVINSMILFSFFSKQLPVMYTCT